MENVYQERLFYDKCEKLQSLNLAVRKLFQTLPAMIPINWRLTSHCQKSTKKENSPHLLQDTMSQALHPHSQQKVHSRLPSLWVREEVQSRIDAKPRKKKQGEELLS